MSFKITITETRTAMKETQQKWVAVDTEEVEREHKFFAGDEEPRTRIKNVMGYAPSIEELVTTTTEIFTQEVQELDLPAVICAVNDINKEKS